jgi:hypothetical protein
LIPVFMAAVCLSAPGASAQSIVAVFSGETGPYQQALTGLKQELGNDIPAFYLSQGEPSIPASARVVVTFGSKAALRSYAKQTSLIYAMAPGAQIPNKAAVEICMQPSASVLIASLKKIQPNLKRLGVIWGAAGFKQYVADLHEAAASKGINMEDVMVGGADEVPSGLRKLQDGKADAIWMPPDPSLLNPTSVPAILEFSRSNNIPFFAPIASLVGQGAMASVAGIIREMGRLAGSVARQALEGALPEGSKFYAATVEISINKGVASRTGVQVPDDVLQRADKVIP